MASRLFSVVATLAVGGALVAGCGSSSSSSSTAASSTSSASTPATSTPSSSGSSTSSGSSGGGSTNSAVAAAAKQGCESAVNNNPALDPSKRSALSADCQKVADAAASGDKAQFKAAYGSFCNDLAGALPSAAQAAAKAACEQSAAAIQ